MIVATVVTLIGLTIINVTNSPFGFASIFATQNDYKKSADAMATFIVSQYQKQSNGADLNSICKSAKKLDRYGLRLSIDGPAKSIYIVNDVDPYPEVIKR